MLVREIVTDAKTGQTSERWVDMPCMSEAEAMEADRVQHAIDARQERDRRIAACDWTALPDAPLDDTQRAAWTAYRQALRDVTGQPGFPDAIIWPLPPPDTGRVVTNEA